MDEALALALRGWGRVSPNPLVGAVVVRGGDVVGRGWYEGPRGNPHAEIRALRDAGDRAVGATVVCTLEPCAHVGSTPPCTEALIGAGVRRVIVATRDPNPIVDGRGLERLRSAGVEVQEGLRGADARRLNEAFDKHVTTGEPLVTLKMAASLDGKVAASDGSSRWISGDAARADVQRLRAGADAVMVGAGTVAADDPALTVRDPRFAGARRPVRVVVDSSGRTDPAHKVFDASAPTMMVTTDRAPRRRVEEWRDAGAEVLTIDPDASGGVSLGRLTHELGKREVQSVLMEGGPSLAWSATRDGIVDRVVVYIAPILIGGIGAASLMEGVGFAPIGDAARVRIDAVDRIGMDLRVEAHVHRDR